MKIEIVVVALVGGLAALGCAREPEDVHVQRSAASPTCTLSLDEDVCAYDFEGVDAAKLPAVRRTVEATLAFARTALEARRSVDDACAAGAADLGLASASDPCDVVAAAIDGASPWIDVTVGTPACTAEAIPACAAPSGPRERCAPAPITVALRDGAPAAVAPIAAMIERRLGALVATRRSVETTATMSGAIAGSIAAVTDLPDACVPPLLVLVRQGSDDVRSAVDRTSRVARALGY